MRRGLDMKSLANNRASVEALKHVLADSYVLTIKVQNVHWNAEGDGFIAVHKHLDEQYSDLSGAVDDIAERIRALGDSAPSSMSAFLSLSRIEESIEPQKNIKTAIALLADDHERLSALMSDHIEVLEKNNDYGTIDLFTQRVVVHDKFAWLLRANI
jgi:starvation-inducible DNA-binding protein